MLARPRLVPDDTDLSGACAGPDREPRDGAVSPPKEVINLKEDRELIIDTGPCAGGT